MKTGLLFLEKPIKINIFTPSNRQQPTENGRYNKCGASDAAFPGEKDTYDLVCGPVVFSKSVRQLSAAAADRHCLALLILQALLPFTEPMWQQDLFLLPAVRLGLPGEHPAASQKEKELEDEGGQAAAGNPDEGGQYQRQGCQAQDNDPRGKGNT